MNETLKDTGQTIELGAPLTPEKEPSGEVILDEFEDSLQKLEAEADQRDLMSGLIDARSKIQGYAPDLLVAKYGIDKLENALSAIQPNIIRKKLGNYNEMDLLLDQLTDGNKSQRKALFEEIVKFNQGTKDQLRKLDGDSRMFLINGGGDLDVLLKSRENNYKKNLLPKFVGNTSDNVGYFRQYIQDLRYITEGISPKLLLTIESGDIGRIHNQYLAIDTFLRSTSEEYKNELSVLESNIGDEINKIAISLEGSSKEKFINDNREDFAELEDLSRRIESEAVSSEIKEVLKKAYVAIDKILDAREAAREDDLKKAIYEATQGLRDKLTRVQRIAPGAYNSYGEKA